MNILVIYDSYFGNTSKVARKVYEELNKDHNVSISHVSNLNLQSSLSLYSHIIIGSPTRYGDTTKDIRKFLKLKGVTSDKKYFVFDTRMSQNHFFKNPLHKYYIKKGYASDSILKILKKKRITQVPTLGVQVRDSDGPLEKYDDILIKWINRKVNRYSEYSIRLEDLTVKYFDQLKEVDRFNSDYHLTYKPYIDRDSSLEYKIKYRILHRQLKDERSTDWNFRKLIINSQNDKILGYVSYSWRSLRSLWIELEIVIFNKEHWNKGVGYEALSLWIEYLFANNINLLRVGLSTWSGNNGMIKLADKLKFTKEACYKKVVKLDNNLYDSISYGLTREEWLESRL